MKLFTQKKVTAYLIGLLFLFSVSGNAQHFGDVNGNALDDTWTAYLDDVTLDGSNPASGDEIGIFDGNTLVGSYTFDGSEDFTGSGQTDYPTICFSEISSGNGYDAGNEITFKYWDASEEVEYTANFDDNNIFLNLDNGEYTDDGDGTPEFPAGANPFSYMDLPFNSGYSVSGTITLGGCNGDVTNVTVSVYDNGGNLVSTDNPDSDGNYEVGGIPWGNNYDLEATLSNYTTYTWGPFDVHNDRTHSFTLNPYTGTIIVDVISAGNGGTIGNATVELFDGQGNSIGTDNSSPYKFFNLCMGDYYAEVSHGNYENESTDTVTLNQDGQSETLSISLDPLPGSISGQVTDDNTGNPISNATVSAWNYNVDPAEKLFEVVTGDNGYYSAAEVPNGTWDVVANAPNYIADSISVTIQAGQANTGNNIALTPSPGALEGTVRVSTTDALLSGVTVNVVGENTTPSTASTNGSGLYSFSEVPAGTHDVKFMKNGFEDKTVSDVTINPNGTTTANAYLDFEHGKINVTLNQLNEGIEASVTIGDEYTATYYNGSDIYQFSDIPAGQYDIEISHPNYHDATIQDVQVVSGQTTNKTFDMVTYHWTFPGGNSMESVWTIYLQDVKVDGNTVDVTDEIAIFNDSDKMVGLYYVTAPLSSGNATNQVLKAYTELNDGSTGYTPDNPYHFKLYDQSAGEVFTIPQVTLNDPNNEGAYTGNVFPSGMASFSFAEIEFFTYVDMTFNLQKGYQIISSRVEADDMDIATIFSGLPYNGLDYVKNEAGLQYRKLGNWTNNIGNWQVTEGYLVKMNNSKTLTMTGTPVYPQKKIYLEQGYNLISYLPANAMNANTAFNGIKNNIDFVRDSDGNHFWKIGGNWINNIGNVKPGEGYFVKMSDNDSLVYPATKGGAELTGEEQPQHFTFSGGDATDTVYTVYVKSDDLKPGDEVAAFDGDKMVGSTVITSETKSESNDLNLFRVVNGGEGFRSGNEIEFRVWSPRTNNEYSNVEKEYLNPHNSAYTDNTFPVTDGNYSIVKLSVNELGIGNQAQSIDLSVYPNPADEVLNIESEKKITEIKVTNMVGQVLRHKRINDKKYTINTANLEPGIYMLETTIDGQRSTIRFIAE